MPYAISSPPQSIGCKPIADIETFTEDKLATADLVEESADTGAKVVKVTGVKTCNKTVSILVHGANQLVLEEAERSLHDALCVIRCLVKKKYEGRVVVLSLCDLCAQTSTTTFFAGP